MDLILKSSPEALNVLPEFTHPKPRLQSSSFLFVQGYFNVCFFLKEQYSERKLQRQKPQLPENREEQFRSGLCLTRKEFENSALFLGLGLPSTLIRHENALQTEKHRLYV